MAKKEKPQKGKKTEIDELSGDLLPQNIVPMGDRVDADKNIYISQATYKKIQRFTSDKTVTEAGGILVGKEMEEFGKTNIIISGFVEAKYCEATSTTLTFTHKSWEYIHSEIAKNHPGKKILGWIHTHPNFGIFLSDYDKFIHENFFSNDNQVAYVVDPIKNEEGFYFWIDKKLEACPGFYIYEKIGKEITVGKKDTVSSETICKKNSNVVRDSIIAVLATAVVVLSLFTVNLSIKTDELEKQVKDLKQLEEFFNSITFVDVPIDDVEDLYSNPESTEEALPNE